MRGMSKDQSAAAAEESKEVQTALQSILDSYADVTEDIHFIDVIDYDQVI
jgi:hypothetical protein